MNRTTKLLKEPIPDGEENFSRQGILFHSHWIPICSPPNWRVKKSKMKKITGLVIECTPVISAGILKDRKLILGRGKEFIVVDSGFNGDISVPPEILDYLDLEYSGTMPFQLADGTRVGKDLWAGKRVQFLYIKTDASGNTGPYPAKVKGKGASTFSRLNYSQNLFF